MSVIAKLDVDQAIELCWECPTRSVKTILKILEREAVFEKIDSHFARKFKFDNLRFTPPSSSSLLSELSFFQEFIDLDTDYGNSYISYYDIDARDLDFFVQTQPQHHVEVHAFHAHIGIISL